jgi:predicted nucleic acid-binding Zn ribbon protein
MRKSNTQTLGEVLKAYIEEMKLGKKLKEVNLLNHWEDIIGKSIAVRTDRLYIKDTTLFVHMNSSVAKDKLMMIREPLIKAINDRVGEKMIDKIVIR